MVAEGGKGSKLPPAWPGGNASFRLCDLLDADAAEEAVADFEPDAVFHLAAQSSAARSYEDPAGTLRINLIGTVNLFEAARRTGTRARFLVTGSCDEYGARLSEEMPLGEDAPIDPVSPYAASKAAQNLLALQYHRAHGLDVVLTRSFNHTGPGQTPLFALPSFASQCAKAAAGKGPPVVRTGNLAVTRDFLDVRDVVSAYRALIERGRSGGVYNVCSGSGLELARALDTMIEMVGGGIEVEPDPALVRPVDMPVLIGDNGALRRDCSWEMSIGSREMISDLVSWWVEAESGREGLTE